MNAGPNISLTDGYRPDPTRNRTIANKRKLKWPAAAALLSIAAGAICYAWLIEPARLVATRANIDIPGGNALNGLKIVAIGDIHGGSNAVDTEMLRRVVAMANAEDADVVVILGDFVSELRGVGPDGRRALRMPMRDIADALAGLRGRLGVFAVLGNHDGVYGSDAVAAELERAGIRVLVNEIAQLDNDGMPFRILGFADHLSLPQSWKQVSELGRSLSQRGDGPIIVLEHSPDILPMLTGELAMSPDLKLILAAHTHGGQVWLPIVGTPIVPSSYGQKYSYGHIREAGVDMFVTSGVGTSILPVRFMMPPEIAVLTLQGQ